MSDDGKPLVVALFWRLIGFGVDSCVIDNGKISGEGLVNGIKGDNVAGADFRLELCLACAEETFDQSAGSGVAWWSVDEFNAEVVTGRAQGVRVVDLGIVEVEFFGRAVDSPCPDERIDKDIEGLSEIIPSFDHVTAVAIDKETEVGGKCLAVNEHVRAFLEVANPEVMGMLTAKSVYAPFVVRLRA